MRALFNSSGEKLFPAVEARFSTLLLPLPTNAYAFAVVDPFHPERRPKKWLRLQATACHRCRSVWKRFNKDECTLRTRPVNRWPKKAWKSGRCRELEVRQYFGSLVPLWSWMTLCQSSFSSGIPRIKYTKVSGNHLLIHVIITFHWVVPLKSIETSQELADRADNLTGGTVILPTLEVNFLV